MPKTTATRRIKLSIPTYEYRYTAVFRPTDSGGYIVTIPVLPGCTTHGRTLAEAQQMATDAVSLYLDDLVAENEPIPSEYSSSLLGTVSVTRQQA